MIPAFRNWSTSPEPGCTTTATVSHDLLDVGLGLAHADRLDHDDVEGGRERLRGLAGGRARGRRAGRRRRSSGSARRRRAGRARCARGRRAASRRSASRTGRPPARRRCARRRARRATSAESSDDLPAPGGPVSPITCAGGSPPSAAGETSREQRERSLASARRAVLDQVQRGGRGRAVALAQPAAELGPVRQLSRGRGHAVALRHQLHDVAHDPADLEVLRRVDARRRRRSSSAASSAAGMIPPTTTGTSTPASRSSSHHAPGSARACEPDRIDRPTTCTPSSHRGPRDLRRASGGCPRRPRPCPASRARTAICSAPFEWPSRPGLADQDLEPAPERLGHPLDPVAQLGERVVGGRGGGVADARSARGTRRTPRAARRAHSPVVAPARGSGDRGGHDVAVGLVARGRARASSSAASTAAWSRCVAPRAPRPRSATRSTAGSTRRMPPSSPSWSGEGSVSVKTFWPTTFCSPLSIRRTRSRCDSTSCVFM